MKKTRTMLLLLVAGVAAFTAGFWMYSTAADLEAFDYAAFGGILLIVGISIAFGLKRYRDERKGLTVDDELSKRIKERAAAHAFIGSIYIWTLLLLFMSDSEASKEVVIGAGILLMALTFFGLLFYHNRKGIDCENPN